MRRIDKLLRIMFYSIITIGLGIFIGLNYDKKDSIQTQSSIPPRPDNTKPMYYDFDTEEWVYVYRGNEKFEYKGKTRLSEEDIQKYLEKKIDGYQESTYWGEEYDLQDED